MNWLKRLPINYYGELHDVKLVQFSVDLEELKALLPKELKVREFNGCGLVSMVNVRVKQIHPSFVNRRLGINYQHVAFRVLVDQISGNTSEHGIFFLKSFTTNPLVAYSANLLSNFKLSMASINDKNQMFELKQGKKFLHYAFENGKPSEKSSWLKQEVGAIDRAYCVMDEKVCVTKIQRENWPIEWIDCYHFETNFFETARFAGAFQIDEPINYHWLPLQIIDQMGGSQNLPDKPCLNI